MSEDDTKVLCDLCRKPMDLSEAQTCVACGATFCSEVKCGSGELCSLCRDNQFDDDDDEESDDDDDFDFDEGDD